MIALNFGFLFNSVWRFIFYIMLGSIGWSYNNIFGKAMGIAFITVAFFNTYVLLRYPSYRKIREKIAEEEDRRIEAKISKDVKKRMANQIMKS
jgi:phosphotransferase system  glucose/maltose/N-acetylglucosamine-specific IIC component